MLSIATTTLRTLKQTNMLLKCNWLVFLSKLRRIMEILKLNQILKLKLTGYLTSRQIRNSKQNFFLVEAFRNRLRFEKLLRNVWEGFHV